MANPTTGLFETLVAAANEAQGSLKYTNAFSEWVYAGHQPINAQIGQTLNVPIPSVNEGDVTDIGNGQINVTDVAHSNVQIVFDKHFSTTFVIKSWDQIRTPRDLYTMYYEPRLEALLRKVNATLFNLVNTTNFSIHSSITGGSDVFTRANLGTAWSNLTGYGVPTAQPGMMAFITHPTVYANMTSTTDFYQESVVGINTAEQVQQKAMLAPAYNTSIIYDQHFTATSGAYPALMFHRYAIAVVSANLPSAGDPSVMETVAMPRPWLPVQIQTQYSLRDQGWLTHMHCGWGTKVVRPEFGQYLVST